jgi:aryl-alcohol dehydrogenase-like predicted oxidoreductase
MSPETTFEGDDLRKVDPKFQEPRFSQYLRAVEALQGLARKFDREVIHLAVRFILDKGVNIALWGGRRLEQMDALDQVFGWELSGEDMQEIDRILAEAVTDPVGPEFMAPPSRG